MTIDGEPAVMLRDGRVVYATHLLEAGAEPTNRECDYDS